MWAKIATPRYFIEPFAGGGIAGLTVAFEQLAKRVILTELDPDVAAVWRVVLTGNAEALAERIRNFEVTSPNVRTVLDQPSRILLHRAFATILRNRVQHGGIMAPGASLMRDGENGKGLNSRWYPDTLAKRIEQIAAIKSRIQFHQEDAFETIARYADDPESVFFVDPPYTLAGRRLYRHWSVDHERLFSVLSEVAGDPLLTYDDTEEVRRWAQRFGYEAVNVKMKSRQHRGKSELLIGRDLSWAMH